jgi:hypothetical protein
MDEIEDDDICNPTEKLDRANIDVYRKYMLDNPYYMLEVFGRILSSIELDEVIEKNKSMFNEPDNYIPMKRRRV